MNASELMNTDVQSCSVNDNLQRAAQIMWENDCGAVPIVDGDGRLIGMVTDRDICMSALHARAVERPGPSYPSLGWAQGQQLERR